MLQTAFFSYTVNVVLLTIIRKKSYLKKLFIKRTKANIEQARSINSLDTVEHDKICIDCITLHNLKMAIG